MQCPKEKQAHAMQRGKGGRDLEQKTKNERSGGWWLVALSDEVRDERDGKTVLKRVCLVYSRREGEGKELKECVYVCRAMKDCREMKESESKKMDKNGSFGFEPLSTAPSAHR